ncbi:2210_t:CDS:2, partial [Ambispora gerdemannii]
MRFFSSVVNVWAPPLVTKKRHTGRTKVEKVQETKSLVHRSSSPLIPQRFSFSPSEQGSYVEPILEHIFSSLSKPRRGNHHAHGITQPEGKWNDEKLQRLSTLVLKVIVCLGDKEAFELSVIIKHKLNYELIKQLISTMKRKHEEKAVGFNDEEEENRDERHEKKRNMTDRDRRAQIVRLAVDENEAFMKIRKSLVTQKNESAKIKKIMALMNSSLT